MTWTARRLRRFFLVLLAVCFLPTVAQCDESEPPDWVARVHTQNGWMYLTRDRLASAVLWRSRFGLKDKGNPATTVLRQLVQEMIVEQEARALGIAVTKEIVDARYRELDDSVRRQTNGAKRLEDVIVKDQQGTVEEFRRQLRHLVVKERVAAHQKYIGPLPKNESAKLAQIEVAISQLIAKARVQYGLPTALQQEPSKLEPGVIALVNGEPIMATGFGEELVVRLKRENVIKVVRQECQAALTAAWALPPEEMTKILEEDRGRWLKKREMAEQEAMRTVSYEDYIRMAYKLDLDALKQDRYFRGLFGLVRGYERQISDKEIRDRYEEEQDGLYGDGYRVTDVEIGFAPRDALLGPSAGGRSRKDALQEANRVLRRLHAQEPVDKIVREINNTRDPTFRARRLKVRNTSNGRLLYEQARILQDGQTSRPFETLAEVHIIRREEAIPAPSFSDVEEMIREGLAFEKARVWIQAQLKDKNKVDIRWKMADGNGPQ